jgi:hypothetical protein
MRPHCWTVVLVTVACLLPSVLRAGEADFQEEDIAQYGTPYFGEAKDVKGLVPLADVRFKMQVTPSRSRARRMVTARSICCAAGPRPNAMPPSKSNA